MYISVKADGHTDEVAIKLDDAAKVKVMYCDQEHQNGTHFLPDTSNSMGSSSVMTRSMS